MAAEFFAEEYQQRKESVGGYTVAIRSYRMGGAYYALAEIDLPGAGARLATAKNADRHAAEEQVLAEARRLIEKRD